MLFNFKYKLNLTYYLRINMDCRQGLINFKLINNA